MKYLPEPFTPYGPDAVIVLFTGASTTGPQLLATLAERWPGNPAAHLAALLEAQCIERSPSGCYRETPGLLTAARVATLTRPVVGGTALAAPVLPPAGPLAPPFAFSYYDGPITNRTPRAAIVPAQLWALLTAPPRWLADLTAAVRAAPDKAARAPLKARLPYVTPAGTFAPTRANGHLQTPSGLLILDFDDVPDLTAARALLLADALLAPAVVLLFTSPSGAGLKALLQTDTRAPVGENFDLLRHYLTANPPTAALGAALDKSGRDVARACFVGADATAWLNPAFAPPAAHPAA